MRRSRRDWTNSLAHSQMMRHTRISCEPPPPFTAEPSRVCMPGPPYGTRRLPNTQKQSSWTLSVRDPGHLSSDTCFGSKAMRLAAADRHSEAEKAYRQAEAVFEK